MPKTSHASRQKRRHLRMAHQTSDVTTHTEIALTPYANTKHTQEETSVTETT
ncbi:Hypothetical predicted protein, partial [Pelobates cultripes]